MAFALIGISFFKKLKKKKKNHNLSTYLDLVQCFQIMSDYHI
jgi:hypothetical protein